MQNYFSTLSRNKVRDEGQRTKDEGRKTKDKEKILSLSSNFNPMNPGKNNCDFLKNIRLQIAEENNIPFTTDECTFEGNCKGTCPRCEAELHYLEHKLVERSSLGKKILVAGLSLGLLTSTLISCDPYDPPLEGDIAPPPDTTRTEKMITPDYAEIENYNGLER